jgi:hypothetical protein
MAPPWAPLWLRQLKNQVPVHTALVLEHPQHGLVLLDACFDGRVGAGEVQPPNSFARAAPNVLRADGATVNGSFRAIPLAAALAAFRGCVWVRHLRRGVAGDAAAMWATVHRLNAQVPRLTQGNTNGANWATSALPGRLACWAARGVHEGLQEVADGLIDDGGAAHVSCVHSLLMVLEAGGLWPHVPHRLDAASRAAAGLGRARLLDGARLSRYARNLAAVQEHFPAEVRTRTCLRAAELGVGTIAPIHAMPVDLSSSANNDAAALFWQDETFLPSEHCNVEAF